MLQSPSQRRLERQRKVLYALISFCSVIVVLGAGYLVIKLNPNAIIVPKIPTIFVDTQGEVAAIDQATPEDATADHSDPADADNTEEPAGEDLTAGDAGNNGTSGGNTGGITSSDNSGGSKGGTSKGTGSATGTFGGRTPTGGGNSTPVNTGSGNTGGTTSGGNTTGGGSSGNTNSGGNAGGNSTPVVTQESINDSYRQQIQSKYHLTVKYGDENGDYAPVKSYVPVRIYDANVIYQYLRIIDSALAVYPSGFFPETMNSGMNLTIYLVKRIGGNISGLTETWENGRVTVMLQTDDGNYFPETMHHELMHYIDGFMRIAKGDNTAASRMAALNPPNYNYGDTGSRAYVFTGANPTNAYFISTYGKTNYLEDRATIFADMVTRGSCPAYYAKGYPLNEKAKSIAQQIESHVGVVSPNTTEYWERCIAY